MVDVEVAHTFSVKFIEYLASGGRAVGDAVVL
jgi:hypothetical protein